MLEDHLVSLQVMTSKLDVYVKLQVLDNEEEVLSSVGKGHTTIPAFIFLKDASPEEADIKRASSRACKYICCQKMLKNWEMA